MAASLARGIMTANLRSTRSHSTVAAVSSGRRRASLASIFSWSKGISTTIGRSEKIPTPWATARRKGRSETTLTCSEENTFDK